MTVVVVAAVSIAAGWASRSAHLALTGLIGGGIALAGTVLQGYLDDMAAARSDARTGDAAKAEAEAGTEGGADPVPATELPAAFAHAAATPSLPAPPTNPIVQRKDFARRQLRPLNSHHGAYALEQAGTDRLFVLAGSVLGARHDQAGVTREDDVAFAVNPAARSAVIAAVADGVGSARLSHVASVLAARSAVEMLSSAWHSPGIVGVSHWHRLADSLVDRLGGLLTEAEVAARVKDLGMPPAGDETLHRQGRPATTLAVIAVDHTADGVCVSWCTVGDCEVAIIDIATGDIRWLTPIDERDGQVTAAVPSACKASHGGQNLVPDGTAVLAMTDGMARLLCRQPEHMRRALALALVQDSALGDLLLALDLRQQGELDDRSVVAVGPLHRDGR